jgi:Alpha amylase, catalytic domain.
MTLTAHNSYTSDYSQAKNVISFLFLSDGIPIVYSGQEQHYSGGSDPANREAIWLSGYSTTVELYQYIATTNKIRKAAIAADSTYITTKVRIVKAILVKKTEKD